jgi:hypothetical protein
VFGMGTGVTFGGWPRVTSEKGLWAAGKRKLETRKQKLEGRKQKLEIRNWKSEERKKTKTQVPTTNLGHPANSKRGRSPPRRAPLQRVAGWRARGLEREERARFIVPLRGARQIPR